MVPTSERSAHERGALSGSTVSQITPVVTCSSAGGDTTVGATTSAGAYVVHACAEAITPTDLHELRDLSRPHAAVREVVETVLMILGYREAKWSAAQAYFDRPDVFLEKMRSFDAAQSVSRLQYQKLCRSLTGPHGTFEEGYAESLCKACSGFVHWCRAVYEVLSSRYGGAPLGRKLARSQSLGKPSSRGQSPKQGTRTSTDQAVAGVTAGPSGPSLTRSTGKAAPLGRQVFAAENSTPVATEGISNEDPVAYVVDTTPAWPRERPDLGNLEIVPDIYMLPASELRHVHNLTIRKAGVGEVTFQGEIDLMHEHRVLEELPTIIRLEPGEVVLYPDPGMKPPEGEGLNRPATITLFQCMPPNNGAFPDPESKSRYRDRIARMTEQKGARFVDYDCDNGIWRFRVDHF